MSSAVRTELVKVPPPAFLYMDRPEHAKDYSERAASVKSAIAQIVANQLCC